MFSNVFSVLVSIKNINSSGVLENPEMTTQPFLYFGKRMLKISEASVDRHHVEIRENCLYNSGYRQLIFWFEVDLKCSINEFDMNSITIEARKYKIKSETGLVENDTPINIKLPSEQESVFGFKFERFDAQISPESVRSSNEIDIKISRYGPNLFFDLRRMLGITNDVAPEQHGFKIFFRINRNTSVRAVLEVVSDMFIIIFKEDDIEMQYVDSRNYQYDV